MHTRTCIHTGRLSVVRRCSRGILAFGQNLDYASVKQNYRMCVPARKYSTVHVRSYKKSVIEFDPNARFCECFNKHITKLLATKTLSTPLSPLY